MYKVHKYCPKASIKHLCGDLSWMSIIGYCCNYLKSKVTCNKCKKLFKRKGKKSNG